MDMEEKDQAGGLRFKFQTYEEFIQHRDRNCINLLQDHEISPLNEELSPSIGGFNVESEKSEMGFQKSVEESQKSRRLEMFAEHQDLIEQLGMELKRVKITGLPTILEESESPKLVEDLKPWKMEKMEKISISYSNPIKETLKFYEPYMARMRKLDILNCQKIYSIDCLQLKNTIQSIPSGKNTSSTSMASFLVKKMQNKVKCDRNMKFIEELYNDLELVYIGQICLSWEMLRWHYEKALELWESDIHLLYKFNKVADELQLFQVLIERFVEDEPFQGFRIQNYAKNRFVHRSLLQVPQIRGVRDGFGKGITSDMLVEALEESIRVFWKFVQGDKDMKIMNAITGQLEDPLDAGFLEEIKMDLQKKEKKLANQWRYGSCILRKCEKRREEDGSIKVLCFFSRLDMRLVHRVLNMRRITRAQLLWCWNKLQRISFVDGEILVQPSFLLFPC